MTEITKDQQQKIIEVLKENNLIEKINIVLLENGLGEYSVKSIQLQHTTQASKFPTHDCKEGYELQWICHNGLKCELKCMSIG